MTRILVVLIFALSPSLTFAEGCIHGHGKQQMTLVCEEGQTFNPSTGACEKIVG